MQIEVQAMLSLGDTLVPLVFMSNRTHLSNFAGNKNEWLVYMTIGNRSSKIPQIPSMHIVVMVTLLTIPIHNRNIVQKWLDEQPETNGEVQNEVPQQVHQPQTLEQNANTESGYYNVVCADGSLRHCKAVLAAWIRDCPEFSNLCHLERHVCYCCQCPNNQIGDYVPSDKQHARRDPNVCRTPINANAKATDAELSSGHMHQGFNAFRHIGCIVSNLLQPDLVHTMQIGMLNHLQQWIFHFMKTHEQLDKYNAICISMRAYHNFKSKHQVHEEVFQWNGKEMKEMSQYLLRVVTQSL